MKVSISYPAKAVLDRFLEIKREADYNYRELNGTKKSEVKAYDNDLTSAYIGEGEATWNKAKAALWAWRQFPSGWTAIHDNAFAPKTGNTVAVSFKLFGIWWLNSARVVYTLDDENCFGFAYGTLKGHVERGEECFWIDRNEAGKIYYHIKAFSKPQFWAARIAYPVARMYQRKFVRESMNIMKQLT